LIPNPSVKPAGVCAANELSVIATICAAMSCQVRVRRHAHIHPALANRREREHDPVIRLMYSKATKVFMMMVPENLLHLASMTTCGEPRAKSVAIEVSQLANEFCGGVFPRSCSTIAPS
jgi:hypothetical protein